MDKGVRRYDLLGIVVVRQYRGNSNRRCRCILVYTVNLLGRRISVHDGIRDTEAASPNNKRLLYMNRSCIYLLGNFRHKACCLDTVVLQFASCSNGLSYKYNQLGIGWVGKVVPKYDQWDTLAVSPHHGNKYLSGKYSLFYRVDLSGRHISVLVGQLDKMAGKLDVCSIAPRSIVGEI